MPIFWLVFAAGVLYLVWKYWAFFIGAGYDPTPAEKVRRMLDLAKLNANDVLYDLGCGDGRLLISAARDFGARAVGIEADPIRWILARWNVRKAGLEGRVRILWGNFFHFSVSEATVVSLFLYQPVNNRLKDKFRNELRKGSRIVSNTWIIDGWKERGTLSGEGLHLYFIDE